MFVSRELQLKRVDVINPLSKEETEWIDVISFLTVIRAP